MRSATMSVSADSTGSAPGALPVKVEETPKGEVLKSRVPASLGGPASPLTDEERATWERDILVGESLIFDELKNNTTERDGACLYECISARSGHFNKSQSREEVTKYVGEHDEWFVDFMGLKVEQRINL